MVLRRPLPAHRGRTGRDAELGDVDEVLVAVRVGLLRPRVAERAVQRAVDAFDGLARNNYDLLPWLSTEGMELTWQPAADR
jgi:predicted RNA-binding protein associated with RNAse of E/G family